MQTGTYHTLRHSQLIALVGMAGAGKSSAAHHLRSKGFSIVRFGDFVLQETEKRGLPLTPASEASTRNELRAKGGMGILAELALPQIETLLQDNRHVAIEGLFNLAELQFLESHLDQNITILSIFTPKGLRYKRLASRPIRPLTSREARKRDYSEIRDAGKAAPIALADYTIVNDGDIDQLLLAIDKLLASAFSRA